MKIENRKKLGDVIKEYKEKNTDNKYKPVAVGRYGIRKREDIYSKELAKDYSKNKLIYKNTLTVGMGSKQIDIGILTEDEIYAVSPAYHTFRINNIDANYLRWTERTEGVEFDNSEDFEDYEKKVNSYLTTHADTLPIYKLRHNQPLTAGDYEMLSKIFTEELGTQEDYDRTFQDTTLGKLVRRIVKMDHDATMQLFSEYIDEHKWNSQQIAFVRNLIAYVEEHGYIDDMSILLKPPFDRPMPFVRLYSPEDQKRIISIVNDINENATRLVG